MSTATAIEKAGVVGAGGAGFPTHVKALGQADTMIANGAECEPLLRSDGIVMTTAPDRVLRGVALMRESVGASRAVIAIKRENVEAGDALTSALGRFPGIELEFLDDVYPAGDEYLLVYELTGRVIPEGGIPPDIGVVVSNVTTLANVAGAAEGRPVTRRLVSVQGAVNRPATFEVPIGVSIGEVLTAAGGTTVENPGVIVGGPMMGRLADELKEPVTKTVGGLVVLPRSHALIASRTSTEAHVLKVARAACCQCMACTELCPRALLGHELAPHRTVRAIQYSTLEIDHAHITAAYLCCECGMCELFA
ncbi:SLBB domain-containing protein, partial [bacterium]|nr:SLBB domain-containing protein [bacterium]